MSNNVKFIASDLDGTILLNGAQSVDESLIRVIQQILDKGIYFAAASGRQITSLERLFSPINDKMMYIGENGALVKFNNEIIVKNPMDYELAQRIIDDVIRIDNCEVLVSGENTAYISPKSEEYLYRMTKVVNYKTRIVKDFREIQEDVYKVAVCDLSGIDNSKDYLFKNWGDCTSATVSGQLYMDFMNKGVSKGDAIRKIQKKFGFSETECMAFGDNFNDIEMLDSVYNSYVMENATDEVKKHGRFVTNSVEKTLKILKL